MQRLFFSVLLLLAVAGCDAPRQAGSPPDTAPALAPDVKTALQQIANRMGQATDADGIPTFSFLDATQNAFVASEVKRLTLEQKAGQMTQLAMDMFFEGELYALTKPYRWSEDKLRERFDKLQVGSVLNHPSGTYPDPQQWNALMTKLQDRAMKTSGVPILYGIDAIHGPNYLAGSTLYAQPLGVAASFNLPLTERLAAMTAYELKAASIPWNFSPAMDVGRNPVWPRTWESFGEDVTVNKLMGAAMVRGYQGDDVGADDKVAACLKHFTGYGSPLTGRDRNPAYIPRRQLREYYFPQYANAIEEGALSVMINSGEVNGVPAHANKWLLTDVLRGEMGFEGVVVSDWEDVIFLKTRHRVAETLKDAARMAIEAGMDMSMTPVTTDFPAHVIELVREGSIPETRINTSVARIIALKVKLGLYEKRVWHPADFPKYGGEEFAALARQSAEEAIVLLQNDGTLPLTGNKKIFLTGPTADSQRSLNGGWTYSWQGNESDKYLADRNTIREALEAALPGRVTYHMGVTVDGASEDNGDRNHWVDADVIVACMGETSYTEIQGNIDNFALPEGQYAYFDQLIATGKPVILVMAGGRPRPIGRMAEKAAAVLYLPYPGPYGGDALAGILSGAVNPSGRLPLTYPRNGNDFVLYDHKGTEEVRNGYNPLYAFGHGISYTTFEYDPLTLSTDRLGPEGEVTASVRVTNTGDRAGKHAVLLFSRDEYASVTPAARKLRAFQKIELAAGASQTVTFTLTPEDLSFIGIDEQAVTETGDFTLMVGKQKASLRYQAARK